MASTYNQNRLTIEKRALRRLGVTNPSQDELSYATEAFQALIKKLASKAPWIWNVSNTESSLTTVSSQREYSAGTAATNIATDIWDIERIDVLVGTTYKPIDLISKKESLSTYEREGTGEPYLAYLERATTPATNSLHLFPTPGSAYTIKYTYQKVLSDADNTTSNLDFPPQALTDLSILLAADLADEYGAPDLAGWVARAQISLKDIISLNYQNTAPRRVTSEYF